MKVKTCFKKNSNFLLEFRKNGIKILDYFSRIIMFSLQINYNFNLLFYLLKLSLTNFNVTKLHKFIIIHW